MGSYVSSDFGYGLLLPFNDEWDEEETALPEEATALLAKYTETIDDYYGPSETIDWYEVYRALEKKFDGRILFELQHSQDYSEGTIAFLKSTFRASYQGINRVDIAENFDPQDPTLKAVADFFGIDFDPAWYVSASYG